MVMCGYMIGEADIHKLKEIGAKDSKKLTPSQREGMFEKLKKAAKSFEIVVIPPSEIDEAVESQTTNLNWLEAAKTAIILNKLKPDYAIIDSPSTNIRAYTDYLRDCLINKQLKMQVQHNAEQHLPVAAASIIAKVTRDREIEKIRQEYGDFGSGYPSDPKTRSFVAKYCLVHPEIFRHSWATYKMAADEKKQGQKSLQNY